MATARAGILSLAALIWSVAAWAADDHSKDLRQLDERVQSIKQQALQLDLEYQALENTKLFPAAQQLRMFMTMEVFDFDLSSVAIIANGNEIASHRYTPREVYALRKGGAQQIHLGNIAPGVHKLQARITGRFTEGDNQAPYEKLVEVSFRKTAEPLWLELRIDSSRNQDLKVRIFQREADL